MGFPFRLILLSSICPLVFFSALFFSSFISLGLYLLFFFSTVSICCCLLAFDLCHKQRAATLLIQNSSSVTTTNTEVTPPPSSSSSPPSGKLTYDVFLSFRGSDTRKNFTDHLYNALKQKGILFTFRDDEELRRGEPIGPNLLKAIEESRYVIVVFSPNYADSVWCLDEIAKVSDCMKEMGQRVLPVFYHVDPSEVRRQTGEHFGKAFEKHQERYKREPQKVQRWKDALFQVGNLSGWHVQHEHEYNVIQKIVEIVFTELNKIISTSEGLVGLDSHLNELLSYLEIGCSDDVRIIGICGMGGIGKTTIAQVMFERLRAQFECDSFLENVKHEADAKQGSTICLQKKLLLNLLNCDINVQNTKMGKDIIRHRLKKKRVLIVLDDVDQDIQLETLCHRTWFGPGSRIIITSRFEHLITAFGADKVYKVNALTNPEALELFCLKAFFNQDEVGEGFLKLSKEFLEYANGHPLAIKVLGSSVRGRNVSSWSDTLKRLKKNPPKGLLDVLKVSFHGLEVTEKKTFLDIACFFKGMNKDRVTIILDGCDDEGVKMDVEVLQEKSLVTLFGTNLWMHDLIQKMGWEVVLQECREEPVKRSRLWLPNEIIHALAQSYKATSAVQSIFLNCPPEEEDDVVHSIDNAFSNMDRLRLLKITNTKFSGNITYLSNQLQYLEWNYCPLDSFPPDFQPQKLVEVHMLFSHIRQLWRGKEGWRVLRHLDLSDSQFLMSTPDFSEVLALEVLVLQRCTSLVEVHSSIGFLKKLNYLDMEDCKSVESLPPFTTLESLEILRLSGCSGLKMFPEIKGNMKSLLELHVAGTSIEELPPSIDRFTGLTLLNLIGCKSLLRLPDISGCLTCLKSLYLTGCSKIDEILENLNGMKCLEKLAIGGTSINELSLIVGMKNLKYLSFEGCEHLVPESFNSLASLTNLTELDLSYCNLMDGAFLNDFTSLIFLKSLDLSGNPFVQLPEDISQFTKLEILQLRNCRQLQLVPRKLTSNLQCVYAGGCTSLTDYPNQIKVLNSSESGMTTLISLNSSELEVSAISKSVIFVGNSTELFLSLLSADGNQVNHHSSITSPAHLEEVEMIPWTTLSMVVAEDDVPEWFSTTSERNPISMEISRNDNKWQGFAACSVFAVKGHTALSLIEPDPNFSSYSYRITFETDIARLKPEVLECNDRRVGSSSHLLVVLNIQSLTLAQRGLLNQSTVVRAIFDTTNPSMVVQKCGIRLVYEEDAGWFSKINSGDAPICLNQVDDTDSAEQDSAWLNQYLKWEKIIPRLEEDSTHELRKNLESVLPRYLEALNSYDVYEFDLKGCPGWFHKSFVSYTRLNAANMSIKLPQNLHKSKKWMGFAAFASLVEDVHVEQTMKEDIYEVFVELGTGERFGSGVSRVLYHVRPLLEEHHKLVVIYIPRAQIPEILFTRTQTLTTTLDLHVTVDSPHVEVQRSGFRTLYGEDIQSFADTVIRCMQREHSIGFYDKLVVQKWIQLLGWQGARFERVTERDSRTPREKYLALHSQKYKHWDWSDPRPVFCDFEGAEIIKSAWFEPFINPGESAEFQLPLNVFDDDNWLGFAACSLFSENQHSNASSSSAPDSEDVPLKFQLHSDVDCNGLFDFKMHGTVRMLGSLKNGGTRFVFIPRSKCRGNPWRQIRQCKSAMVTMRFQSTRLAVNRCGLRLVYKEDIEHLEETLILAEFF